MNKGEPADPWGAGRKVPRLLAAPWGESLSRWERLAALELSLAGRQTLERKMLGTREAGGGNGWAGDGHGLGSDWLQGTGQVPGPPWSQASHSHTGASPLISHTEGVTRTRGKNTAQSGQALPTHSPAAPAILCAADIFQAPVGRHVFLSACIPSFPSVLTGSSALWAPQPHYSSEAPVKASAVRDSTQSL